MGRAKEAWMEQMERGYGAPDGDICAECVNDPYLVRWIKDGAEACECTFCGAVSEEPIAANFEEFVGVVMGGIRFDWNSPESEGVVYETREGGWQANLTDTADILWDMDISDDSGVIDAIQDAIDIWSWVPAEFYRGSESDRLTWGWDSFKAYVKNETRYFFLAREPDEYDFDELTPSTLLGTISNIVRSGDYKTSLIRTIDVAVPIVRIRIDSAAQSTAPSVGTPKPEFAIWSNRMSPAGIPMFYGAFDYVTALAETLDPERDDGKIISAGTFRPLRPLRILDLASLPDIPSVFDETGRYATHSLRFLYNFAGDISKPIARDGREHIEYVPTQIVTEYFRRIFRLEGGGRLDGIAYASSKRPGGIALVLFCENHECIDASDQAEPEHVLRLIGVEHHVATRESGLP